MDDLKNNPHEWIYAISSLWKLGLVVVCLIFITTYRKQLGGFLDRLQNFRFKKGDSEISIEQKITNVSVNVETEADVSINGPTEEKKLPPPLVEDSNNLLSDFYRATNEQDFQKADELFKELQSREDDIIQRKLNEAFYYYLMYVNGRDCQSIEKLNTLSETEEIRKEVLMWVALCYEHVQNYNKAIEIYNLILEQNLSDVEKAKNLGYVAYCWYSLGKSDKGIETLTNALTYLDSDEAKLNLYGSLANLYRKVDNKNYLSIALQKTLQYKSDNKGSLFDSAYAQGDAKFFKLSLMNYETLLGFNSKHLAALNNIGVTSEELEMPIKSVEFYKRASKEGNSLAKANLAYQYMNSGFASEAQEILDIARREDNPHRNIGEAITHLSDKIDQENKKWNALISDAIKQQHFFWEYAEALFVPCHTLEIQKSRWSDPKRNEFILANNGQEITLIWDRENEGIKFEGPLSNRAAEIKCYIKQKPLFSSSAIWEVSKAGYLYISKELENITILLVGEEDEYVILKRNKLQNLGNPKN